MINIQDYRGFSWFESSTVAPVVSVRAGDPEVSLLIDELGGNIILTTVFGAFLAHWPKKLRGTRTIASRFEDALPDKLTKKFIESGATALTPELDWNATISAFMNEVTRDPEVAKIQSTILSALRIWRANCPKPVRDVAEMAASMPNKLPYPHLITPYMRFKQPDEAIVLEKSIIPALQDNLKRQKLPTSTDTYVNKAASPKNEEK